MSRLPVQYDLSYYRGRTNLASVQWQDSDEVAVDLTGYTVSAYVRDDAGTLLASTDAGGITATVTPADGLIVLTIDDNTGRGLPLGKHRWDVWAVSSGGIDEPLVTGAFTVIKEARYA